MKALWRLTLVIAGIIALGIAAILFLSPSLTNLVVAGASILILACVVGLFAFLRGIGDWMHKRKGVSQSDRLHR